MDSGGVRRSTSRPRPSSRPTTPLRPGSRTSIRDSYAFGGSLNQDGVFQPAVNALEPQFAELADSMADLEANFMHLQLMHESLSRFNESFASFLYGLNMNAFCVDFPEAPIPDSFKRAKQAEDPITANEPLTTSEHDGETTFMTSDTSFVDNPPVSAKSSSKSTVPASSTRDSRQSSRASVGGRYSTRGSTRGRTSGLARPRARGIR
ncbi:DASH complex component Dam1 [Histoplasma capsulatum]|uniref:DASH complex subunit DAM1 n=1 Tax=Ajellomyces capsulatus TaxID=5037 RepID=A0A8A1MFD4_AJECA|nr:DASH complex component Dam1 [Histoplasma capsulatum]